MIRIAKWFFLIPGSLGIGWALTPPRFLNDEKIMLLGILFVCISGLCLCKELHEITKREI